MRRRGFNIEALPNLKGSALETLSRHTETVWLDKDGNTPKSTFSGVNIVKKKRWDGTEYETLERVAKNRKQMLKALESDITEDGRYHIKWTWAKDKTGHIITMERTNGVMKFYDPQNGKEIDDFVGYIDGIDTKRGIRYLRVDNLRPNVAVGKNVLTRPTSKVTTGTASEGGTAKLSKERRNQLANDTRKWARESLPEETMPDGNKARRAVVRNAYNKEIVVNPGSFDEIFSKNKNRNNLSEILAVARDFESWIPRATFVNTEAGVHHNFNFNVYEVVVHGQRIQFKTKLTDKEYLYNLRFI